MKNFISTIPTLHEYLFEYWSWLKEGFSTDILREGVKNATNH